MNERVMLNHEDILNKEFKVEVRGYRMQEVDSYLDEIIKDFIVRDNNIKRLEDDNVILSSENQQLREELRRLKTNLEAVSTNNVSRSQVTNIDLLKRLGDLEKAVFGKRE